MGGGCRPVPYIYIYVRTYVRMYVCICTHTVCACACVAVWLSVCLLPACLSVCLCVWAPVGSKIAQLGPFEGQPEPKLGPTRANFANSMRQFVFGLERGWQLPQQDQVAHVKPNSALVGPSTPLLSSLSNSLGAGGSGCETTRIQQMNDMLTHFYTFLYPILHGTTKIDATPLGSSTPPI